MFELRLKFHWNLFLRVQSTIFQRRPRYWPCAVPEPTRTTRTPEIETPPPPPPPDSHNIPSKKKTKSKLQIKKKVKNWKFEILQKILHATHLLKLLEKMYKHEMHPIRTVGATERTRDAGRTDGQTDGVKPIYPQQLSCAKDILMLSLLTHICVTQPQWVDALNHFQEKEIYVCVFYHSPTSMRYM